MHCSDCFKNRVALVTGAGSETGIGYAAARILAAGAARVAVTSTTDRIFRRAEALAATGAESNGYVADLTDRRAVDQLVKSVLSAMGRIDILVNNAGMIQVGQTERSDCFADMRAEDWDRCIDQNLNTCFNVTHRVLPGMIQQQYGRIVNVSSVTGPLVSNPGAAGYSAGKAAMAGMSRAIAIEAARHGITINNVAPGWIATGSQTRQEAVAGRNTPMGRSGTPAEVGQLIAFLASDDAGYITGQLLVIDGGNLLQEYKGPREDYY